VFGGDEIHLFMRSIGENVH